MAFASVATLGSSQEKTSDTSLVLTTSATLQVGNLAVLAIALDNFAGADGDNGEIASVVDSAGNTWVEVIEHTNSQGSAAAGATVALWYTIATSELASGGTITITLGNAVTAKAASAWEFTTAAASLSIGGSTQVLNDGADPAAISLASLPSREYLWVHALAEEVPNTAGYTEDADYTSMTADGTTGGSGPTNMRIRAGFRIMTGTGDTVDVGGGGSSDSVQVFAALYEPSVTSIPVIQHHRQQQGAR